MQSPFHGVLVVDKPTGMSSRAAVDRCMGWFPRGTRVGHTGTLDPLASGVLVLCVGTATRLGEYVQRMVKTYRSRFLLGVKSACDDVEGTLEEVEVKEPPNEDEVFRALESFVGAIEQVPPAYSAAKVTGRRAYELARRGQKVSLKPRRVHIYKIELLDYAYPHLDIEVECGKGTYIRALARDFGDRLGCGAVVETLRRTRVGPFNEAGALSPEASAATAHVRLLPLSAAVAGLPRLPATPDDIARLRRGQPMALSIDSLGQLPAETKEVAVFDDAGALVAVTSLDWGRQLLQPVKVLS